MPLRRDWSTPFEQGYGNSTTTWEACIDFLAALAEAHPQWLRLAPIGRSDGGRPLHHAVFSADGVLEPAAAKDEGRPVLLLNNGIHPGEPEGIDVCMALLRDLCLDAGTRAALGRTVIVTVPVYNVDGACERGTTSRANQVGPEQFGFRGTARHLDLNRDFVKAASSNSRAFAALFAAWDPDVMLDTHTSNGADYQHVLTLIATQPDKLGGACGELLRGRVLPALYAAMAARGLPMCPYVNPVAEIPDDGIADFLDSPRYSTGLAALHHTIGFMTETHMLKPFGDRYRSTRAFVDALIDLVHADAGAIRAARASDRAAWRPGARAALAWALDPSRKSRFRFSGYRAERVPSRIGRYQRLRYDRSRPYEEEIDHYDRYVPSALATLPAAYLMPQAWPEIAERLRSHGARLVALTAPRPVAVESLRIVRYRKGATPFEGAHLHEEIEVAPVQATIDARPGDWIVPLGGPHDRLLFETLEPLGMDSFFRWGFFDAVLDRKEGFSDYVFEDRAEQLLQADPALQAAFERWKDEHPEMLGDAQAVLGFIHRHVRAHDEPGWRRYPVFRIVDAGELAALMAGATA